MCSLDEIGLQLSQAAVYGRIRFVSCVLQFRRRTVIVCSHYRRLYQTLNNSSVVSAYLENLCDYLYDDLRPRILHEPRLTALCEVCTVLQALMVLDVPSLPSPTASNDNDEEDNDE